MSQVRLKVVVGALVGLPIAVAAVSVAAVWIHNKMADAGASALAPEPAPMVATAGALPQQQVAARPVELSPMQRA